ncbi:hypothetical protein PQ469_02560 [Mucilaginibacter sp. KACC 22773]|uniref:hypothetical protein n=1 Tax=Mucilaginibacter sp. KACC 22773 TaxID=3025671 RepID=UPI002365BACF|nr:hypothetical protein [Mucilaginibacter sp. KACC 22773]WDF78889.1 hypothetical protein PQ469_02560 [Mucilaginibacter sp. KACC 22773]
MIADKLKLHLGNYVKITRTVAQGVDEASSGYILNFSDNLILLHEAGDFTLQGYSVIPVKQVKKIRHNKFDKCFKQIMIAEGEADKVGISYKIDLSSWQSVFKSIQATRLNAIVEVEDPADIIFSIGPILKITTKKVHIEYFDAEGFISDNPDKIDFEDITKVKFDDRYINVFSKYLRKKKAKKE